MTNKPRKWWLNCKEYETVIIKPYKEYDLKLLFLYLCATLCLLIPSIYLTLYYFDATLFGLHVFHVFHLPFTIYVIVLCSTWNFLPQSACPGWMNDGYASANSQPKTCPESLPNNFPLWRFLNLVFLSFSHYWLHVSFCQQKRRFFLHCSLLNVCLSLSSDLFLSQYRPPLTYSWASLITFSVCPWDVVHISIVVSHNWIVCL